jgi:DNA-binding transcriptional ArsR family regulator
MADQDFVLAPATAIVGVSIALEPVYNAINTLGLLARPEHRSGFSSWITQTAARLTPEQVEKLRMIFSAFDIPLEPNLGWPSFPAYIDYVESLDPVKLRDQAVEWTSHEKEGIPPLDRDTLLANKGAYLEYITHIYTKKALENEKDHDLELSLFSEAHDLFNDPVRMQRLIVDTLRDMWTHYLAAEWERTLPMLQESVEAFSQLDYNQMTALEATRVITGRDLSGIWDEWGSRLVFVPSPHLGPYVTRYDTPDKQTSYVVFGARLPEGARVNSPALSRSELLVRLSALADDTRLQILELLTQHDELCAQDVIDRLKLSQSAASRHLRQLTATGYLLERRSQVAKCYSLNPARVDDTLRALKRFLRAK